MYNEEHVKDLTPFQAERHIGHEVKRQARHLAKTLFHVAELAGFKLSGAIVLTSSRTGQRYTVEGNFDEV